MQAPAISGSPFRPSEGDKVNRAPFFIVGSGRSGTTLLRMILASHSRLTIPPETWYLLRLFKKFDRAHVLGAADVEAVVEAITTEYRWPDMKFDTKEFRARAKALNGPFLRDIIELVYLKHLEREGKPRWGDKTPGYIEIVPQLALMFPDAQFIHFFRDGRDVARSFQTQGWYGKGLRENTREWNDALDCNRRWRSSPLAHRILQVRYEDLVLDTKKTAQDLCRFLGEEFEPQMLSWQGRVDDLVPAREAHIHGKLKHMPSAEDVYRWKREMTAREVFISEAFMGRHLEEMGYERRYKRPPWPVILRLTRWYYRAVMPVLTLPARALRALHAKIFSRRKLELQANRQ